MAGIGFRLNRILRKKDFGSLFRAYGYAGVIGSGPWLLAVTLLGFAGVFLRGWMMEKDYLRFYSSLTHIFSFTLILTGAHQMVMSRYAADREYEKKMDKVFPALMSSLLVCMVVGLVVSWVFFIEVVGASPLFGFGAVLTTMCQCGVLILGIYMTALQAYERVLFCYAVGYFGAFGLVMVLGRWWGADGAMAGFGLGQALLFLSMLGVICRETTATGMVPEKMWREWRRYWELAAFGVIFNAAIWVDKFQFWWLDSDHLKLANGLYAAPVYDLATCLSILSIVPGMAVFLLKLETIFAIRFTSFYDRLRNRATYGELTGLKREMILALRSGLIQLLKVQGVTTLCCLAFAPVLADRMGMGMLQVGVFETLLLGSFLLVLLQSLLAILFYLDKRREVLLCSLIFFIMNFSVTWWNIEAGASFYGLGFLAGTGAGVLAVGFFLTRSFELLEYETFTSQPLYPPLESKSGSRRQVFCLEDRPQGDGRLPLLHLDSGIYIGNPEKLHCIVTFFLNVQVVGGCIATCFADQDIDGFELTSFPVEPFATSSQKAFPIAIIGRRIPREEGFGKCRGGGRGGTTNRDIGTIQDDLMIDGDDQPVISISDEAERHVVGSGDGCLVVNHEIDGFDDVFHAESLWPFLGLDAGNVEMGGIESVRR